MLLLSLLFVVIICRFCYQELAGLKMNEYKNSVMVMSSHLLVFFPVVYRLFLWLMFRCICSIKHVIVNYTSYVNRVSRVTLLPLFSFFANSNHAYTTYMSVETYRAFTISIVHVSACCCFQWFAVQKLLFIKLHNWQ